MRDLLPAQANKKGLHLRADLLKFGGPCRIRTYDQRIKSPLLYQLS